MSNEKDLDTAADYLNTMTDLEGAAVLTVKDGSLIMFKRETLEKLLAQNPASNKVVIFLKIRPAKDVS